MICCIGLQVPFVELDKTQCINCTMKYRFKSIIDIGFHEDITVVEKYKSISLWILKNLFQ